MGEAALEKLTGEAVILNETHTNKWIFQCTNQSYHFTIIPLSISVGTFAHRE